MRKPLFALISPLLLPLSAAAASFGGNPANVLILLDTSGSMSDLTTNPTLLPYAPAQNYSTMTSISPAYSSATVYQEIVGTGYQIFTGAVSAEIQAGLSANGFWFGTIDTSYARLFTGNYLNYQSCSSCRARQRKMDIAKRAIRSMVSTMPNTRFGVMRFINNGSATNPPGGGGIVSEIGSSTTSIAIAVNAISPSGWTPLGEQLRDGGSYYRGQFGSFASPIQSACQMNSIIVVSDGMYNGLLDPRTEATLRFTQDHSSVFAGPQNIVVHTVGFSLSQTEATQALPVLQQTAANGGGNFFVADDANQLDQALVSLPPFIAVSSPANLATVAGTLNLAASVPNSFCIAGVQFKVDGVNVGAEQSASPFGVSWNSRSVPNGTHVITAVARDSAGNTVSSLPLTVFVNNAPPPIISNVSVTPGITDASISWLTDRPADTQIHYGLSSVYTSTTPLNATLATSHNVSLTGLTPGTVYHFEALSRDAGGNLAVLGDLTFATEPSIDAGPLDHFRISFANGGAQSGPGVRTGTLPYALFTGECFSTTIEAVDSLGRHSNFTGPVTLAQYIIDNTGLEVSLAEGISLRNSFQLGISSMELSMVNGFVFLGSETDPTKQLCFYRATRAPGDAKTPGALGDLQIKVIKTNEPAINGLSSSYVGWNSSPSRLALLLPNQTLAPATPTGISTTSVLLEQRQGRPFEARAYLTDQFFNPVLAASDMLRFSSSRSTSTSFNPPEGTLSGGVLSSIVTVNTCGVPVTLRVEDSSSPVIQAGEATLSLQSCSAAPPSPVEKGFFELSVPGIVQAGSSFAMSVRVKNTNIPAGTGDVFYNATLAPLIPIDITHFSVTGRPLGVPRVEFAVPDGNTGDFTFNISNQSYAKAETIWIQIVGAGSPEELAGTSAIAGPIQVIPGAASRMSTAFDKPSAGAGEILSLRAAITDEFGNGIPNAVVAARVDAGSGRLSSAGTAVSQHQIRTDANGTAVFTFISGMASEINKVSVWTPETPTLPTAEVLLSVSLLGDKIVAAYPNPTNISQRPVTFEYRLERDGNVTLFITDLFGREVWRQSQAAGAQGGAQGFNKISWDGRNGLGRTVAVGVYILHMEMEANGQTTRAKTKFGVLK